MLSTKELAEHLGVSLVTVRRDLDGLDAEGRIERVFGGARLVSAAAAEPGMAAAPAAEPEPRELTREAQTLDDPFDDVLTRNPAAKRAIASRAAGLIRDGETVFLDIGTTVYELARALADRRLTVVTASLGVIDLLGPAPEVELVVLGGDYNKRYRCTQGPAVAEAISLLQIDRVVLGCSGISDRGAVRDTDARQTVIKRAAAASGAPVALLADSTKFPGVGAYTALDLSSIDHLVTDIGTDHLAGHLAPGSAHGPTEVLTP